MLIREERQGIDEKVNVDGTSFAELLSSGAHCLRKSDYILMELKEGVMRLMINESLNEYGRRSYR